MSFESNRVGKRYSLFYVKVFCEGLSFNLDRKVLFYIRGRGQIWMGRIIISNDLLFGCSDFFSLQERLISALYVRCACFCIFFQYRFIGGFYAIFNYLVFFSRNENVLSRVTYIATAMCFAVQTSGYVCRETWLVFANLARVSPSTLTASCCYPYPICR